MPVLCCGFKTQLQLGTEDLLWAELRRKRPIPSAFLPGERAASACWGSQPLGVAQEKASDVLRTLGRHVTAGTASLPVVVLGNRASRDCCSRGTANTAQDGCLLPRSFFPVLFLGC